MPNSATLIDRRTAADVVFDALYERIGTLGLMPNAKISEAEIAAEFGVSRQPVRDAFSRLGNIGFVTVRPQKATVVRPFSLSTIRDARFVRLSVELNLVRTLAASADPEKAAKAFADNLDAQRNLPADDSKSAFYDLDDEFHRILCNTAGYPNAHDTIAEMKIQVDRLCKLSIGSGTERAALVEDHHRIVEKIAAGDVAGAETAMRTHLARLDRAIEEVRGTHSDFFDE